MVFIRYIYIKILLIIIILVKDKNYDNNCLLVGLCMVKVALEIGEGKAKYKELLW